VSKRTNANYSMAQPETRTHLPWQKGISVELPVTSNAIPAPDADQEDAFIVTVTDEGSVYVGIGLTTTAALAERVKVVGPIGQRRSSTSRRTLVLRMPAWRGF
jgi:biopolymer transport protein ExbD